MSNVEIDVELDLDETVPAEGYYLVTIEKAQRMESKAKDSINLVLDLKLVDVQDEEFEGYIFRTWLSTKKQALFNIANLMRAVYGDEAGSGKIKLNQEFCENLEGKEVFILGAQGEYNGAVTFTVDAWVGAEAMTEVDPEDRRFQ